MIERLKMKLARLLDRNPDYCWAELVMWAQGYRDILSILPWHPDNDYKTHMCKIFKECNPSGWCGKCKEWT
jgi:hypothetical protein